MVFSSLYYEVMNMSKIIVAIKSLKDEKVRYLNNYIGFEFQYDLQSNKDTKPSQWLKGMMENIIEYIEEIDARLEELGADLSVI